VHRSKFGGSTSASGQAETPNHVRSDGSFPRKRSPGTLGDLINAARAKPGALTGASLATSQGQFVFETLKRAAKVDMTFVPYPGAAPEINALLGGHVTFILTPYAAISERLKAGRLCPLAIRRSTWLPVLTIFTGELMLLCFESSGRAWI
jgi:hypothetical protein